MSIFVGAAEKRFFRNLIGSIIKEYDWTGGVPRQSCIFAAVGMGQCSCNMAAADADESPSRLPKQDTGGSDALCLGAPAVQRKPWHPG